MLARWRRARELTTTWVPDAGHEAMRDLIRLRGVVRRVVTRPRVCGVGDRHDVQGEFTDRANWSGSSKPGGTRCA